MFFDKFDQIKYDPTGEGVGKDATNILNALLVKHNPIDNAVLWFYHTVTEGDSPEVLAFKYYGNTRYHWVIMFMNQVVDPFYDWTLDPQKFAAMVDARYGAGNAPKLHHMTDLDNDDKRIDEVAQADMEAYFDIHGEYPVNIRPVSNYDYEWELNDVRREVRILQSKYLTEFLSQFETLMSGEIV